MNGRKSIIACAVQAVWITNRRKKRVPPMRNNDYSDFGVGTVLHGVSSLAASRSELACAGFRLPTLTL
eukprot:m.7697 g.7697  ORF g.7697 m.7697 type:complete len:68 (-) comp5274_c0_seq1:1612-1815(-)